MTPARCMSSTEPGLEPLFRKIRRRIDDDLAAIPMRTRDAPDQHHLVPISSHRALWTLDSLDSRTLGLWTLSTPRLPDSPQSLTSRFTFLPSRSPVIAAMVRMA